MSVTKEYLRSIFDHDGDKFIWKVSPDGVQPIGIVVNTSPLSKGKPMPNKIRVRGQLFTVQEIEAKYEVTGT